MANLCRHVYFYTAPLPQLMINGRPAIYHFNILILQMNFMNGFVNSFNSLI